MPLYVPRPTNLQFLDLTLHMPPGVGLGLTEDVELEEQGELVRDANRQLFVLRGPGPAKYNVTISGSGDWIAPAVFGMRRGDFVRVALVDPWSQMIPAGVGNAALVRRPLAGSVAVYRADGTSVGGVGVGFANVTLPPQPQNVTVTYRPILDCLLESFSKDRAERAGQTGWQIALREV